MLKLSSYYEKRKEMFNCIIKHHGKRDYHCFCCGEKEFYYLEIDHIYNDGYKDRARGRSISVNLIKENPERFQLLCSNCNKRKHYNGGKLFIPKNGWCKRKLQFNENKVPNIFKKAITILKMLKNLTIHMNRRIVLHCIGDRKYRNILYEDDKQTSKVEKLMDDSFFNKSLKKPAELIDIVEAGDLSLHDRRIYNMLVSNAYSEITSDIEHRILKSQLAVVYQYRADRLGKGIEALMKTIVRLRSVRDGKIVKTRVKLLGTTDEEYDRDGWIYYRFPAELRQVLNDNIAYARLKMEVMLSLSSKYALALYEIIQKRGNLKYKWYETMSLEDFRALLGIPKTKLMTFGNLNSRCIKPALQEVNSLADFGCKIEPLKYGGKRVIDIRLSWWKKDVDDLKKVYQELQTSRVGRRDRMKANVEHVVEPNM